MLGQGTLRPDLIESASSLATVGEVEAACIKTHHNDTSLVRELRREGKVSQSVSCWSNFIKSDHCYCTIVTYGDDLLVKLTRTFYSDIYDCVYYPKCVQHLHIHLSGHTLDNLHSHQSRHLRLCLGQFLNYIRRFPSLTF